MSSPSGTEIIVEPGRRSVWPDLGEVYAHRELLRLFVLRDFRLKYRQTLLGPAWHLLQPLVTTAVFTLIFHRVARVPTAGVPPVLFYFCGLLIWQYFAQSFVSIAGFLIGGAPLFKRVYYPRLTVPVATLASNLLAFFVQAILFITILVAYAAGGQVVASDGFRVLLVLPFLILQTAAIALGAGLLAASLAVRYRDLHVLIGFFVNLWLYMTPIVYPSTAVPQGLRALLYINPLAPIVETFRSAVLGGPGPGPFAHFVSLLLTLLILAAGLIAFNRVERHVVDVL